ncbi:Bug family tripartite tricarboxylate transporter substrate binding protein [Roseateles chitinivorans]|uniref:Bug family tripartite tricarboxylate transporter substrate binding protein n=1 Tax=Roseateles chitinivorans TaxID=2917965 RepID=UPI003D6662FD
MTLNRRTLLKTMAGSPLALALPSFAADAYPSKPVTLVVPQPAGGGADALCRALQAKVQESLGQTIIIDNRAGAAGNIGTQFGLGQAADGYTAVFVNLATVALNPHLYSKTGYKVSDMQPVILLAKVANIIVANPGKVSAKNLKELIAQAKATPGKLTYGTAGNGSGNHLGGEMLKKMAGIDLMHVPYKGGAPAINAVLGGEIDLAVADPLAVLAHVKAGTLRAIAVTSPTRSKYLPDLPSVAETVPGYDATSLAGIVVPKGTPAAAADKLNKAFGQALKNPEIASRLASQLYEPSGAGPTEFASLMASEDARWAKLIKQLNVQLD